MTRVIKPLAGVRVLDAGRGMAAGLVVRVLHGLGASISRVEAEEGDPFYDVYPAYRHWHARSKRVSVETVHQLLDQIDIVICGGETYPGRNPVVIDPSSLTQARLIVVQLEDPGAVPKPQVEILAQARSGLAFEQFSTRPLHWTFPACSYAAALQALLGIAASLQRRDWTGQGACVRTSLDCAASMWVVQYWLSAEREDAAFARMTPRDVRPLIVEGKDGGAVHFAMSIPGALARVHAALETGLEIDPLDGGFPGRGSASEFFGDVDLFREHAAKFTTEELVGRFEGASIPVEPALLPGECWDLPQARFNAAIESDEHGRRPAPVPFHLIERAGEGVQARGGCPLVIDFGAFVAGPFTGRLLADLGCDVIKVEPLTGDPSRNIFRTAFATNCGKRSLSVDAKSVEGQEILRRLIRRADIVSHNFRPDAARRLGLDFEQLASLRPGIVVLASCAYGEAGPKAAAPGFDYIFQALCGHERRAGGTANPPLWYRSPITDYATGTLGALAALVALRHQRMSGASVKIENNLLNVGIFLMSELVEDAVGLKLGAPPNDAAQLGFRAQERFYRCRDGWIALAVRGAAMSARLAQALELARPDEGGDWSPDFRSALEARLLALDADDALNMLQDADIWVARCVENGWERLKAEAGSGTIRVSDDAHYGTIRSVGSNIAIEPPFVPGGVQGCPQIGEHTRQILAELSFSEKEITELFSRNIVR